MTPEQKQKLDEIRDKLAKKFINDMFRTLGIEDLIGSGIGFRAGFDTAIEHLMPAIEALEYDSYRLAMKKILGEVE